jgi:pyruvate dehydrogenase E1 component alpha subunit
MHRQPRNKIDTSEPIEYISILDETGKIDKKLEPNIPNPLLLKIYRKMLLVRRFDERMISLQRQGRIGTFPPVTGQEAAHMGAVAVLRPSDWMVPSFRETGAELWRGRSLESILIYYAGYSEGARIADDRNDLPVSIPVGSQILHAVGLGWAIKYR